MITVKDNQPTLHDDIRQHFLENFEAGGSNPSVRIVSGSVRGVA